MLSITRALGRYATLSGVALTIALGLTAPTLAGSPEAPFGDKVSDAILNYNRATPNIATAGRYGPIAVAEVKALGFVTIVDLRGPEEEGVAANVAVAKAVGLKHFSIPVTTKAPRDAQVSQFAAIVEDRDNHPILVNCVSANRVGAMWALYRAQAGVSAEVAVEEGRTAGLKSREAAVRERLGLPALAQ